MPSFRDDPRTATRSRWINTGGPSRRVRSMASILGNDRSVIGRRLPRLCGELPCCPAERMQPGMAGRFGAVWQQLVVGVIAATAFEAATRRGADLCVPKT
jgi:hypothetical protein